MHVTRQVVDACARVFARDLEAGTIAIMTPAVRKADNPGAYRGGHFDGDNDRARFRSEPREITVAQIARFSSPIEGSSGHGGHVDVRLHPA